MMYFQQNSGNAISLTIPNIVCIIVFAVKYVPVAQLDRATDYGSVG